MILEPIECSRCHRAFGDIGGFTGHECQPAEKPEENTTPHDFEVNACGGSECRKCGQWQTIPLWPPFCDERLLKKPEEKCPCRHGECGNMGGWHCTCPCHEPKPTEHDPHVTVTWEKPKCVCRPCHRYGDANPAGGMICECLCHSSRPLEGYAREESAALEKMVFALKEKLEALEEKLDAVAEAKGVLKTYSKKEIDKILKPVWEMMATLSVDKVNAADFRRKLLDALSFIRTGRTGGGSSYSVPTFRDSQSLNHWETQLNEIRRTFLDRA